jgi:hypothetical protein
MLSGISAKHLLEDGATQGSPLPPERSPLRGSG